MNDRATGRSFETNTAGSPWRANHRSARSTSCSRRKMRRPNRSTSGRPPSRPIAYAIHDPARSPVTPAAMTAASDSGRWPAPSVPVTNVALAAAPPSAIVASDGIGMHVAWSAINRNTATYPWSTNVLTIRCSMARGAYPTGLAAGFVQIFVVEEQVAIVGRAGINARNLQLDGAGINRARQRHAITDFQMILFRCQFAQDA